MSDIIGVDIDGVLNHHRKKFCEKIKELRGIDLLPEEIKKIPVREIEDKGITQLDEIIVFNDEEYWSGMYPIQEEFKELEEINKSYDIWIISQRPWPLYPKEFYSLLKKNEWESTIFDITKKWLIKYKIPFDNLIIVESSSEKIKLAIEHNIKLFVEDDPKIINMLKDFCSKVFMMDQPYNKELVSTKNVECVQSWKDVVHKLNTDIK